MIFQGEDISMSIRGYTVGYDYYAPEQSVGFHHYSIGANAKERKKVHLFWENRSHFNDDVQRKAMKRLLGIVHLNPEVPTSAWDHVDEDIYGLGGVRTPEQFYEMMGIDVHRKTVQDHLCQFVDRGGKMHHDFTHFLRSDGMGIDYSQISFRFGDPGPR